MVARTWKCHNDRVPHFEIIGCLCRCLWRMGRWLIWHIPILAALWLDPGGQASMAARTPNTHRASLLVLKWWPLRMLRIQVHRCCTQTPLGGMHRRRHLETVWAGKYTGQSDIWCHMLPVRHRLLRLGIRRFHQGVKARELCYEEGVEHFETNRRHFVLVPWYKAMKFMYLNPVKWKELLWGAILRYLGFKIIEFAYMCMDSISSYAFLFGLPLNCLYQKTCDYCWILHRSPIWVSKIYVILAKLRWRRTMILAVYTCKGTVIFKVMSIVTKFNICIGLMYSLSNFQVRREDRLAFLEILGKFKEFPGKTMFNKIYMYGKNLCAVSTLSCFSDK